MGVKTDNRRHRDRTGTRWKTATRLLHFDAGVKDPYEALSVPLYQTATFEQPGALDPGEYDYTRSGNPTRTALQRALADLDGARTAHAFASGMAALTAVVRLVPAGGEILAGDDLYGGTFRLLGRLAERHGVDVRHVDPGDPDRVAKALTPRTRLVLVESPTNPLLKVCDLRRLAERVHDGGAWLAVDNSLMSPYLQRPLDLGADLALQSATKALSGHGDLIGGVVATSDPELSERLAWTQNAEGTGLAPFDSWLLLRSLKTLSARLGRQEAGAHAVADFLRDAPGVRRLHYPGSPDHPGHDVHRGQADGAGSVMSFETGCRQRSARLVDGTRLFTTAVSFGSVMSVISMPCAMSHASIPEKRRRERPLPPDLVRLSIGLEDPDDLIDDLSRALAGC